ncbi:MAG: hypothetical protein IK144_10255 [Bacteroidaceae bacterium]|nr:hypothetical protein [Bacteroidaceae bacterium]
MSAILTIGINEKGEQIKIDDAAPGKKCNCYCPKCKKPLIAKNKIPKELAKREHHFAHLKGCSCEATDETLLHYWAKEILMEVKSLRLPEGSETIPAGLVRFQSVEIEKWDETYGFRPDAEATLENGEKLLIEFLVSHKITTKKRKIIVDNKLNVIEIDLNYVALDKDAIKSFLLNDTDCKEWIGPAKTNGESGEGYPYHYKRNPLHFKVLDYIKELFDKKELKIYWDGEIHNLHDLGYDICESSRKYKKFSSDLTLYRSQKEDKGYISISVRGRRRNVEHYTPRDLRVIDITVRELWTYLQLIESDTLSDNGLFVFFENFKYKAEIAANLRQEEEQLWFDDKMR